MNRREFLKKTFQFGLVAGTVSVVGGFDRAFAAVNKSVSAAALPDLAAVKGGLPAAMFSEGIKALGGMKAFVKPGQSVVVKPNIGWDVPPEGAANTNPGLVSAIIKECYSAGAKKVFVFDHTCDNWTDAYANSGIEAAVKSAGGILAPGDKKESYKKHIIPGGKAITSAEVHELITDCDVFINVPILKSHGSTKVTIGLKNNMGIIWNRGLWHVSNIHQCIADFAAFRKPDLTVVDAYRVMTRNGPRGTSVEDVVEMGSQILSRDPVAADAAAAKIFGVEPGDIAYIKLAHEKGIGNMNLSELKIKKIYL
jgi:uncharacterized protein (DUF362 family)